MKRKYITIRFANKLTINISNTLPRKEKGGMNKNIQNNKHKLDRLWYPEK